MKKLFGTFVAILVLGIIIFRQYATHENECPNTLSPTLKKNISAPDGIDEGEERAARLLYDFERFKDPVTNNIPANIREKELAFLAENFPTKTKKDGESSVWRYRGPINVGGRTRAFAFDVADANTIISGGVTGGIFKSTDSGQSFRKVTTPEQLHSLTALAQDKRTGKTNVWYAGSGESYGIISIASFSNQTSGDGIFKSTDNGETWQVLTSTTTNTPQEYDDGTFDIVWRIITDNLSTFSTFEDIVYAAVQDGIMRSTDGGQSWQAVLGFAGNGFISQFSDIIQASNGVFYATLSKPNANVGGFFRSTDGISWTNISPTNLNSGVRRTVMATNPCNVNEVYFLSNTNNNGGHKFWKYTYKTGDGSGIGGAWADLSDNLPEGSCGGFYDFEFESYSSQDSYDMCLLVKPDNCDVIFLGGTNVYRSEDGFTTPNYDWIGGYFCDTLQPSNYVYPNHHPDIHYLLFHPYSFSKLYTASDGGLHYTDDVMADTVSWTSINNAYNTTQFYTVAIEPGETDNDIVVGGMQDNGTYMTNTTESEVPWKKVFYGDGAFCEISSGRDAYYLSWQGGKIFKLSINDVGEIQAYRRIDPDFNFLFIQPFILDPSDENTMYLFANNLIWRHTALDTVVLNNNEYDALTNWEKLNASVTNTFTEGSITILAKSIANQDVLYYGTSKGRLLALKGLSDGNISKVNLSDPTFPSNAWTSSIALNDNNPNEIIVTFSNYNVLSIFRSLDAGETWENIGGNLEENADGTGNGPSVTWAAIMPDVENPTYYVGTSIGLFSTQNMDGNATVWQREGDNVIGAVPVSMIKTRLYDHKVVVATHGNGMFSNDTTEIVGLPDIAISDKQNISSSSIFPNPFEDNFSVSYHLQQASEIQLQLITPSGKTIQQVNIPKQTAGAQQYSFDSAELAKLPSGVYYLIISDKKTHKVYKLVKLS
ncbi:MAG: T9SS type A sorting domain-containing protein [Chitinophagales bacterium]|nr:T9SS type A sorting domain-containing protein [Bacteroidota bacterium]MCB9043825.1 T9SS type A sorting domain-containing protein [Chitinophagales bacterium]